MTPNTHTDLALAPPAQNSENTNNPLLAVASSAVVLPVCSQDVEGEGLDNPENKLWNDSSGQGYHQFIASLEQPIRMAKGRLMMLELLKNSAPKNKSLVFYQNVYGALKHAEY